MRIKITKTGNNSQCHQSTKSIYNGISAACENIRHFHGSAVNIIIEDTILMVCKEHQEYIAVKRMCSHFECRVNIQWSMGDSWVEMGWDCMADVSVIGIDMAPQFLQIVAWCLCMRLLYSMLPPHFTSFWFTFFPPTLRHNFNSEPLFQGINITSRNDFQVVSGNMQFWYLSNK